MTVELSIIRADGTRTQETHKTVGSALASYSYNELSCAYTDKAVVGLDMVVRYDQTQEAVKDALSEIRGG